MYFESFNALLMMDGHGAYVWAAYGITLCVLMVLLIGPGRRQRRILKHLGAELRRQQGAQQRDLKTTPQGRSTPGEEK